MFILFLYLYLIISLLGGVTVNKTKILEVKNISKNVKGKKILDDISFDLFANDICGFLGPNGSGKTTLIRILTGLIHPTKGNVVINGTDVNTSKRQALKHVGAIVESPIFFSYMTGKQNLINLARITSGVGERNVKDRVKEVLKIVGLENRGDDKVDSYSLGMKQRLGIAQALLGEPQFIILDEPSNGLDPVGMKELRELILALNRKNGITFLISSHLIKELEMVCKSWVMINKGKITWQGKDTELGSTNEDLEQKFIEMMTQ
ncbi:ATP-binding cassette domain-containing protein [Bacillus lacus]|uniref:ATP-binding cassette domain-containing protein n=1 Tax=Metabacillus lacus TaxID=1983721 RepID=A0A7X2IZW1_9BACI|nr:ATP-binding cassette domain-containing protein [Metabacillus lacus]